MHCGGAWLDTQHWEPGSRSNVLKLREARQTVVYAGWGWIDLPEVRRRAEEALKAPSDIDRLTELTRFAEDLVRMLPARDEDEDEDERLVPDNSENEAVWAESLR